jgi:hypothetical protein
MEVEGALRRASGNPATVVKRTANRSSCNAAQHNEKSAAGDGLMAPPRFYGKHLLQKFHVTSHLVGESVVLTIQTKDSMNSSEKVMLKGFQLAEACKFGRYDGVVNSELKT